MSMKGAYKHHTNHRDESFPVLAGFPELKLMVLGVGYTDYLKNISLNFSQGV